MELIKIEKTKAELEVIDDLLAWLLLHHDLHYELGMLLHYPYEGIGQIVDVIHSPHEKDKDKVVRTIDNVYVVIQWLSKEIGQYNPQPRAIRNFIQYDSAPKPIHTKDEQAYLNEVRKLANGEVGLHELVAEYFPEKTSEETGVMIMNKAVLMARKKDLIAKQDFMKVRVRAVQELLEQRKDQLRTIASKMGKFITKLNRLIWSIELYLGIKEELHQLSQGMEAPADEPIHFRQRRLYMDEEIGDPMDDNQGMDFKDIKAFDEWLLQYNNYHKQPNYEFIVPEPKCVVILRVRRDAKQYNENPFINAMMNQENMLTYVLIRNGDNLYRIYADIVIGEQLFPNQEELTNLVAKVMGEYDYKGNHLDERDGANKAEEKIERYKLNMILLQGIIERTPCFPANAATTNIFDPNGYEGKIKFLYDADTSKQLPSNIKPFWVWMQDLRKSMKEGSRIYYSAKMPSGSGRNNCRDSYRERFFRKYYEKDSYNLPSAPKSGIYQLYKAHVPNEKKHYSWTPDEVLYIAYNPKDYVYSWTSSGERKNNVSYQINYDDEDVIHWDALDRYELPKLEYYLHSRIDRYGYLRYMKILMEIMQEKRKEIAIEDDFIKLCLHTAGMNPDKAFDTGVKAMEWWKLKNKWKRALTLDDAKALRMIVNRLEALKKDRAKVLAQFAKI